MSNHVYVGLITYPIAYISVGKSSKKQLLSLPADLEIPTAEFDVNETRVISIDCIIAKRSFALSNLHSTETHN